MLCVYMDELNVESHENDLLEAISLFGVLLKVEINRSPLGIDERTNGKRFGCGFRLIGVVDGEGSVNLHLAVAV